MRPVALGRPPMPQDSPHSRTIGNEARARDCASRGSSCRRCSNPAEEPGNWPRKWLQLMAPSLRLQEDAFRSHDSFPAENRSVSPLLDHHGPAPCRIGPSCPPPPGDSLTRCSRVTLARHDRAAYPRPVKPIVDERSNGIDCAVSPPTRIYSGLRPARDGLPRPAVRARRPEKPSWTAAGRPIPMALSARPTSRSWLSRYGTSPDCSTVPSRAREKQFASGLGSM